MTDMGPTAPSTGNPAVDAVRSLNSPQVRMVRSLEALVSKQDALLAVMGSVEREVAMLNQRSTAFGRPTVVQRQQVVAGAQQIYSQSSLRNEGALPSGEGQIPQAPSASGAPESRQAPQAPPRRGEGGSPEEMQERSLEWRLKQAGMPETWQQGRSPRSLSDFRKGISSALGERIQQIDLAKGDIRLPDGRFMNREDYETAIAGSPDTPGWFNLQGVGPGDDGYAGFRIRQGGTMMLSDFGTALGKGAGLGSALQAVRIPGLGAGAMTVGKVLGPIALAGTALQKGVQFVEGQRATNMQYQQALGGGNFEGFGERFRRQMGQFGAIGTLGAREAGAIFDSALDMYGSNDAMRQEYTRAATDLYMQSGMTAAQSQRLLSAAAQSGETDLTGLARTIRELGTEARLAGVSATEARSNFADLYGTLQDSDRASRLTQMQMQFGGPQRVGAYDASGLYGNVSALVMAGAAMGTTAGSMEAMLRSPSPADRIGAEMALSQVEGMGMEMLILQRDPVLLRRILESMGVDESSVRGGRVNLTREDLVNVGRELQAQGVFMGSFQGIPELRKLGISVEDEEAYWQQMALYIITDVLMGEGVTQSGQAAVLGAQGITPETIDLSGMPMGQDGYSNPALYGSPSAATASSGATKRADAEGYWMNDEEYARWQGGRSNAGTSGEQRTGSTERSTRRSAIDEVLEKRGITGPDSEISDAAANIYAGYLLDESERRGGSVVTSSIIEGAMREGMENETFLVTGYNSDGERGLVEVDFETMMANESYLNQLLAGTARVKGSGLSVTGMLGVNPEATFRIGSFEDEGVAEGKWIGEMEDVNEGAGRGGDGGRDSTLTVEFMPQPQLENLIRMVFSQDGVIVSPALNANGGSSFTYNSNP